MEHLNWIDRKYYSLIRRNFEEQLKHEPLKITRNRKPLKRIGPFGATWELRFGPGNRFRVFYMVNTEKKEVIILAIGIKKRERLYIGGEVV